MAKPLSDILKGVKTSKIEPGSTGKRPGVDYAPKSKGDQDFVAKHKTEKHADRVGNEDDVYKGNTKYVLDKASEKLHGNDEDNSIKVHESIIEATVKQINDRMDSLMSARKAEKTGNKQAQYMHMANYHSKFSTQVKNKSDITHHKAQADRYKSAAKSFEESTKCNMTEEGKYCPVHENTSCYEQKNLKQKSVKENHDDESAEMAKTQLRALANKAIALAMFLSDDQVVEPWVQAKIAVAKDNVTAVHDYMVYGDHDKSEKEQTAPINTSMTFPNMNVDVNTGGTV